MRPLAVETMLTGMEVREVAWDDADGVRRLVALSEAVRRADSPWAQPRTERGYAALLRHGWDGEPPRALLATEGGIDVAAGEYETSTYDNLHLAWVLVEVHPEQRRRGHGSALLQHLLDRTRADGRTSVGIGCWDAPGPRAFAERHGFEARSVEVNRRQHPREVDRDALDRLYAEAAACATAYELVRQAGATPPAGLAELAELTAAINDAPTDDLDIEDEVFPPERVAAYEHAQLAGGHRLYRVLARHRDTGELAGHTVVVVETERPHLAEQHDTAVAGAHRGHRLGLLLKAEMLRWLAEAEPQLTSIDTWNAASNGHMIGVNEALGYRVVGRAVEHQRSL